MRVRGITHEDFLQYKKACMFIATCFCTFKCEKDCNCEGMCQNSELVNTDILEISNDVIVDMYMNNMISEAVVFGGLEPLDQFDELLGLIRVFRKVTDDDIVIYTGYNRNEVEDKINLLKPYNNIIIKFGRYVPGDNLHYDSVLGVSLASNNQYAEKIS